MLPVATVGVESYMSSVLLFSALSLTTYFLIKTLTGSKRNGLPLPPNLPSLPVLGSSPFMTGSNDLPEFFRKTSERLGPVFGLTVGSQYSVVLNTREIMYEALVRQSSVYSGRLLGYTFVTFLNPQSYGIIGKQYGADFRRIHQLVLRVLKDFGFGKRIMQERILVEVDELIELIKASGTEAFNPSDRMSVCTMNVIGSIVFGERISQKEQILAEQAKSLREFLQAESRQVDVFPALRYLPKFKAAIEYSLNLQREQMKYIDKQINASLRSDRSSFVKGIDELMNKEENYRNDLNFIIRELLLAGSEPTSSTILYYLARMANHQDIQKRVQAELDSVVEGMRPVTLEDIPNMPYVEATILENLRRHQAGPLALPHYTLEDSELAGFFIPKGTMVFPNIYSVHRDPSVWKEPESFRPERFLDKDGTVTGKELIMTFSLGKRSCLGEMLARQEIYLIMTNLLHKFNILPPEGQDNVVITENFFATSFPSPFKLRFVPRK